MRKNIRFAKLALVTVLAGFAVGCQTGSETSRPDSSSSNACEKLKNAGDYNTASGRSIANVICSEKNFPDYKSYNQAVWRENTRQRQCLQNTGKLCED